MTSSYLFYFLEYDLQFMPINFFSSTSPFIKVAINPSRFDWLFILFPMSPTIIILHFFFWTVKAGWWCPFIGISNTHHRVFFFFHADIIQFSECLRKCLTVLWLWEAWWGDRFRKTFKPTESLPSELLSQSIPTSTVPFSAKTGDQNWFSLSKCP